MPGVESLLIAENKITVTNTGEKPAVGVHFNVAAPQCDVFDVDDPEVVDEPLLALLAEELRPPASARRVRKARPGPGWSAPTTRCCASSPPARRPSSACR